MKSVLISIQPKWCELIANGKKTIEVRKTKPKIATPFKCYIYCTKPKMITKYVFRPEDYPEYMRPDKPVFCKVRDGSSPYCSEVNGNGKVIGQFVCYKVTNLFSDSMFWLCKDDILHSCFTADEMRKYANGANNLYGWHISDLVIYDKPKELSDFATFCKGTGSETDKICKNCWYLCFDDDPINGYTRCGANKRKTLTRPPQSWCYVKELR